VGFRDVRIFLTVRTILAGVNVDVGRLIPPALEMGLGELLPRNYR
jgi:hypothetical protein